MNKKELSAYEQGFIDGICAHAWERNGQRYVGKRGIPLDQAISDARKGPYHNPALLAEDQPSTEAAPEIEAGDE